jgi:3-oxoacyl-[acyl-carrier protein] reductase
MIAMEGGRPVKRERSSDVSRVALVTGAAWGIGAAVAAALHRQGYRIALHYWDHEPEAHQMLTKLDPTEESVRLFRANFEESDAGPRLIAAVQHRFGRVDILVNNAASGVTMRQPFSEIDPSQMESVLRVNVTTPFVLSQHVAPLMSERGWGRIINMASVNWRVAYVQNAAYIMSKAALVGLTRALARELGPAGVTVNAIAPGDIRTEAAGQVIDRDAPALPFQSIPRPGRSDDVVSAVRYLIDDQAGFITGQVLVVDGGWVF